MEHDVVSDCYHVLICDDDAHYRSSQMRMLNLFNWSNKNVSFKAYEAASGQEAMDLMNTEVIDCVLLDYNMPGLDGVETTRLMLEQHPEVGVVIVTGAGSEMTAVKAMKVGAMDYLRKGDIGNDMLERAIVNAVSKSRMQHKIELQAKGLIEAERHRVMLESLTAACHHLAQPVTVLRTFIILLKRNAESEENRKMIMETYEAVEVVSDVLWKLNHLDEYKTEIYLSSDELSGRKELRMLKL